MTTLSELRARFPQYNEATDGDFLAALNRKFYPKVHPRLFVDSIEGATNAYATIKRPELREWYEAEVSKPIGTETDDARAKRLGGSLSPSVSEGGRLGTAARSALQGLTFGAGDEVVAGGVAALRPDLDYSQALEMERARLKQGREAYKWTAAGSEIGGGVLTGLAATGGLAPATTLAGRVAQAMGIGGASGTAYGALSAEGGPVERGKGGLLGGLLGAGVGAASVPVEIGLRQAGNSALGLLSNISGKAKPERVDTALAQALAGTKRTPAEISDDLLRAVDEGQPVYTLADAMGTTGQRELSGAARLGGRAKEIATEALDRRQAGQGERVGAALAEQLNLPDTATAREAAMRAARRQAADVAYDAARQGASPVDVRRALAAIDDRIGPMQGSGIKGDGIDTKLAGYRARLAANNPAAASPRGSTGMAPGGYDATPTAVELSDFDRVLGVKQSLQDDIGAAARAGRNNEARELGKVVAALDEALEASSDGYRTANDAFRSASREIDQIEVGRAATSPGKRSADTVRYYEGMTPSEQGAFRYGYGDRLMARLENAPEGVNKARPFTSQKSTEELSAMAREPGLLARALDRENVMFDTRRIALGGSQTADNLADMQGVGGLLQRIPRSMMDAVSTGANWASRMSKGQNDATRAALVDALLSTGDKAAANIAKAVAQGEKLTAEQTLALRTILYLQGGGVAQTAK